MSNLELTLFAFGFITGKEAAAWFVYWWFNVRGRRSIRFGIPMGRPFEGVKQIEQKK